ncbi:hypothetical protein CRG98_042912 [Punica granatum]|uniref:Uncharacterized protein n=1 Tax=Punica granatum TaxID=22663 RepID=A0A2I0HYD4_PUNGR|nr:hypothetical protein CRG98_042912 [Punica granatum]
MAMCYNGTCNNVLGSFTRLEELEVLVIDMCPEVSAVGECWEQTEGEGLHFPPPPSPPPGDRFPNLKMLHISSCPKLKHLLLVPGRSCCSSTLYLKKLQEFAIHGCGELKRIIAAEVAAEEESVQLPAMALLPSMSTTSPMPPDALSQLKSIEIRECPKMKNVATRKLHPLLHNLQWIQVINATNMEDIIVTPSPPPILAATSTLFLPLLTMICVGRSHKMKRVLTLELFMLLPNLHTIMF